MESAIRVRAVRSALHGSENAVFPSSGKPDLHQSGLTSSIGRNRPARYTGIDEKESIKKPETIR